MCMCMAGRRGEDMVVHARPAVGGQRGGAARRAGAAARAGGGAGRHAAGHALRALPLPARLARAPQAAQAPRRAAALPAAAHAH